MFGSPGIDTTLICVITLFWKSAEGFSAEWTGHNKWDYDLTSEQGPDSWNVSWPDCSGETQSPIDIDTSHVWYGSSLTVVDMVGYESIPARAHWELINAGHSIHLQLQGDYKIRDGGLLGEYKVDHIEFHWSSTDAAGSEHSIDGKKYAMELQIIHYNTKYKSHDEALAYEDGLAVLSFLLKIGRNGNPAFSQIINNLPNLSKPGSSVSLRPIPLFSLLPINTNNYYRYTGSLTIPPCLQIVQWTVFSDAAEISEKQLKAFQSFHWAFSPSNKRGSGPQLSRRSVPSSHGATKNCRPQQGVHGRTIYSSDPDHANILNSPMTSNLSITVAFSLGFVIMMLVINRPIKHENDHTYVLDSHHED